jgi:ATP-dependent RNA helicase DDX31/DBP7
VLFLRGAELAYLEILKSRGLVLKPIKTSYESLLPAKFIAPTDMEELGKEAARDLQHAFETLVATNKEMENLAQKAFQSFIGAYAVHSSDTKHVFVARSLHLGHVAKSFALKEPPRKIAGHLKAGGGADRENGKGKRPSSSAAAQSPGGAANNGGSSSSTRNVGRSHREVMAARSSEFAAS